MWKKDESINKPSPFGDDKPDPQPSKFASGGPPAVIGASLIVEGTVTGDEDLLVEGQVKGDISLPKNIVTVGAGGRVQAKIRAAVIVVEGKVKGDLIGEEQIEIRRSGNVNGNIVAPRVGLEDGAQFKGNIDMSPNKPGGAQKPASAGTTQNSGATSSSGGPRTPSTPGAGKDGGTAGQNPNPKLSG